MTSIGTMILSNQIYFLFLYSKITIKTLSYIHLLDICQVNTLPSPCTFFKCPVLSHSLTPSMPIQAAPRILYQGFFFFYHTKITFTLLLNSFEGFTVDNIPLIIHLQTSPARNFLWSTGGVHSFFLLIVLSSTNSTRKYIYILVKLIISFWY